MEFHHPSGHMDGVVPLPAIIRDPVLLLQLVHGEYVRNFIWEVPYIQLPVRAFLVSRHRSGIAVDPDPLFNGPYVLQILVALEGSYGGAAV